MKQMKKLRSEMKTKGGGGGTERFARVAVLNSDWIASRIATMCFTSARNALPIDYQGQAARDGRCREIHCETPALDPCHRRQSDNVTACVHFAVSSVQMTSDSCKSRHASGRSSAPWWYRGSVRRSLTERTRNASGYDPMRFRRVQRSDSRAEAMRGRCRCRRHFWPGCPRWRHCWP